jgi:large subunit ribosomal protein L25
MLEITLELKKREVTGKKVTQLRQAGIIPSVIYGGTSNPVATQSPMIETTKVVKSAGKHTPVHLAIDGKKKLAIIKTIDIDPVKHVVRHVAFQTIKQNETVETEVPIRLVGLGESEAERAGLIILQAIEQIEIKAKPADLPEALELSVANLTTTDDKLVLGDITLPNGVEFADIDIDTDLVVANVYEPSALQAANDAAGGTAEPEKEEQEEEAPEIAEDSQAEDKTTDLDDANKDKSQNSEEK